MVSRRPSLAQSIAATHPYCQGSWELQQLLVIILLSHSGTRGARMEPNHTQVTAAVTRARCAEGR